ncbi:lysosomal acid phosphatase-like [Bradysia coprophila]|uniref:lysosomal acid phosphatase-like n=1 Tax=Bradysia coprophila TaxID=38358 RepID=UPI00187D96D9|nr:lysosomal acid phosphatase-like [Bradysia coprophila]
MFVTNVFRLLFLLLNSGIFLEIDSSSCNVFDKKDFDRNSELKFVHVLFRHGDRSPIIQAPGDLYDQSKWPDGLGQLTNLGKQQQFNLGKWLRSRYNGFLSPSYKFDEIYIQSSDVDRTLMSAQANLAGLYAPRGRQIWNPLLLWQPIPVHTQPQETDYLIAGEVPLTCTSYQKALEAHQESPEYLAELQEKKPFFDYISYHLNATVIENYMTLLLLWDGWVCNTAHNLRIPSWAKPLFLNNEAYYKAALKYYYLTTETPYLAKYFGGFLLKDILDRLSSKVGKTLDPDRKFWIYSSHDSKVFGFLNSLGVSDNKFAGYTATVIVELRSYKDENYVQIIYKNLNETPYVINIPGCGYACPLEKMYEIYATIIPKQPFDVECQIDE